MAFYAQSTRTVISGRQKKKKDGQKQQTDMTLTETFLGTLQTDEDGPVRPKGPY